MSRMGGIVPSVMGHSEADEKAEYRVICLWLVVQMVRGG